MKGIKQRIYEASFVPNTKLLRSFPTSKTELKDVCRVQLLFDQKLCQNTIAVDIAFGFQYQPSWNNEFSKAFQF